MRARGLLLCMSLVALLGSLAVVVWRQGRALEVQESLARIRAERAVLDSERAAQQQRIHRLESRGRVVAAAAELGLRVPVSEEIVLLPEPAERGGGGRERTR